MDPSAAPWRALESAAPATVASDPAVEPRSVPLVPVLAGAGAIGLVAIAFILAFGSGGGELRISAGGAVAGASQVAAASPGHAGLVVEVVGAVVRPGVYRMAAGARVGDLVAEAGGYSARVDVERAGQALNLAALLEDGTQVRVPSRDEPVDEPTAPGMGGEPAGGSIDLNTATSAQLEELPGIGPATAAKLIASREQERFTSVDDLRGRSLVGEKTFEKIRALVTVR